MANKRNLTCSECSESVEKGHWKKAPCDHCKIPRIREDNIEAYCISLRALYGAMDPQGGVRYDAIHTVLRGEGYESGTHDYREMFKKVLFFVLGWLEERAETREQEQRVKKNTRVIRR